MKKIAGIHGWLLFFTIVIVIKVLYLMIELFTLLWALDSFNFVELMLGIILFLIPICLYIYSFSLELNRKRFYPKVIIFTIWLELVIFMVLNFAYGLNTQNYYFYLIQQTFGNMIITAYLRQSKRVKNTFII